jgi:hypothetical protein
MGYNHRKFRLLPHNLSPQQRNDCLKQNEKLVEAPGRFILMGDEFWFVSINEHQKFWLALDSDLPEVARRRINTYKVMVTLFWNISGLYVSNFLACESFDADCFVSNVLSSIHHLVILDVAQK